MSATRTRRLGMMLLMVGGLAIAMAGSGWAEEPPPQPEDGWAPWALPTVAEDSKARGALATAGAVVGSVFYIPFKALGICPLLALGAGVHYAVTVGSDTATDAYLLRAGCAGTYIITPGMVRGQTEFQGMGAR